MSRKSLKEEVKKWCDEHPTVVKALKIAGVSIAVVAGGVFIYCKRENITRGTKKLIATVGALMGATSQIAPVVYSEEPPFDTDKFLERKTGNLMPPFMLGEQVGLSSQKINRLLFEAGLQEHQGSVWKCTELGELFGECKNRVATHPYSEDYLYPHIWWDEVVLDILRELGYLG